MTNLLLSRVGAADFGCCLDLCGASQGSGHCSPRQQPGCCKESWPVGGSGLVLGCHGPPVGQPWTLCHHPDFLIHRCHSHLLETQCFHRENDTMCPTGENHKILLGFESTFSSSWKSGWLHAMLGCGHPMSHVHDPRFRRRRTPDDGPAGSCGCLVKPSGAVI